MEEGPLFADGVALLPRSRITFTDPAIHARSVGERERGEREIAAIIAERSGRDASDLDARCAAAAIIALFTTLALFVDSRPVTVRS
ncbi:hypothetical protein [Streptomyces sp. 142MFCol3.1]|uniref:acyl-CoA-like ligand-binding transcription factor n=1 Tax=Streptomyces sp. 142MFCol3.1 TaxID=1172179 RepID=UPI0003FFD0D0|nr:hypothetical protein [Streptomyces sp. 142MFCol3.1]